MRRPFAGITGLPPSIPMTQPLLRQLVVGGLAALLLAGGAAYLVRGAMLPWIVNNDTDMGARWHEYQFFKKGVYPHFRIAEVAGTAGVDAGTVYPPYAYPIFAAVFWTPNFGGARVVFQLMTLAALALSMWYGAQQLGFAGPRVALLGAAVPLAFSGNCSAIALGQFSIICTGFLVLQMVLLERRRPAWAGLCWGIAMLKPQIALPFVSLFLLPGQWRGLATGFALLACLSAFALWWTNVTLWNFWVEGVVNRQLPFIQKGGYGAGSWISALGANPRYATLAGLTVCATFAALLFATQIRNKLSMETTAAASAVLAMSLFYHRHYDNIALFLLLLPLLVAAFRQKRVLIFAAAALLGAVVYAPPSIMAKLARINPATEWVVFAVPIAALIVLIRVGRQRVDAA